MRLIILFLFLSFNWWFSQAQTLYKDCKDTQKIIEDFCEAGGYTPGIPNITIERTYHPPTFAADGTMRTHIEVACFYQEPGQPKTNFHNWGCQGTSGGVAGPKEPPPPPKCPLKFWGSVIRPEEGSVSEDVAIVGTPFKLIYSSQRTIGNSKSYKLPIGTTSDFAGSGFRGANFSIIYSNGRHAGYSFGINQSATFIWDGKNASGDYTEAPAYTRVESTDDFTSGLSPYAAGYTTSLT